ncbi:MAG: hypothetical protein ISR77_35510 [Pirellulaceae bacterium]|nr:hypothetical protein [Pirellulaceae bacterium]
MLESLSHPIGQRLTLTLLHFIWQGVFVAVALQMILALCRVRAARTRYALSLAALIAMGLCPIVTFSLVDGHISPDVSSERAVDGVAFSDSSHPAPRHAAGNSATTVPHPEATVPTSEITSTTAMGSQQFVDLGSIIRRVQPYALGVWLVGVFVLGIRFAGGYANTLWMRGNRKTIPADLACRIEQLGRRLGLSGGARVYLSDRVREATAVGFWRPIVLLPLAWLAELPPQALEAIVAHELAHIRRWDLWVNLYQRVLETLLFYHPAVWWISRRVGLEREMCCDELALATTGGRIEYANALNLAARLHARLPQPALAASFLGEKKMNLLARVRNVLGSGIRRENGRWWPVGLIALLLPLVIWAASASLLPSGTSPALAGDDERGAREGEREGDRESPEARARREGDRVGRESPEARARREGDREGRESPEARARREGDREGRESPEARTRREGDRERGDSPEARSRREGETMRGFRPQTDREASLYGMITQLQQEVAQLRRELGQMRGGREGVRRDGDRRRTDAPRDGDRSRTDAPRDGDRVRSGRDVIATQTKMFEKYDRNGDKKVVLEEFLALREGTRDPEVKARWQQVFAQGDRNRDGSWSLEEFVTAARGQRREGDARRTDAPRDGDRAAGRDAPRDGDRPRTDAPRDGDRRRTDAPRDGDRRRTDAPRETDQPPRRDAPRDGDAPARDKPKDGEKADRDAPRDG